MSRFEYIAVLLSPLRGWAPSTDGVASRESWLLHEPSALRIAPPANQVIQALLR